MVIISMGKIKKDKKMASKNKKSNETLTEKYDRFAKINTDSDADENEPDKKPQSQFNVVSPENEEQWMKDQGIMSYRRGENNFNIGMGTPLTEKEFQELQKQQKQSIINA